MINNSEQIEYPSSSVPRADVEDCLNQIRPAMEADGGGVRLVSVQNGIVYVQLQGTCLDCPSASLTLSFGIQRTLQARFPWVKKVERVGAQGVLQ